MNLNKLYEAQRKLDERIVKEKGLENEDLLDKKILALQVELGELANEYRGFKFWSENPKPNIKAKRLVRLSKNEFSYGYVEYNPLLEEYVDCLHFILSIGNDLGLNNEEYSLEQDDLDGDVIDDFVFINKSLSEIYFRGSDSDYSLPFSDNFLYRFLTTVFLSLGKKLGFTWEQIERAYFEKNKINHERQESGY